MIAAVCGLYLLGTGELFRLKAKEWGLFLLSVFAPLLLWLAGVIRKTAFLFEADGGSGSSGPDRKFHFEGHEFPFSFYYDTVFGAEGFIYRWLLLICIAGLAAGAFWFWRKRGWKDAWENGSLKDAFGYLLWFLIPFLGFSLIGTKLIWYCYPCTVPLAMGAAVLLEKR